MPYAIMQTSLDPPTVEQLAAAFRTVPRLTPYDAALQAKDAFGVLIGGLSFQEATAIQTALKGRGVGACVAEEAALPVLPPTKTLARADWPAECLVLYEVLGRPRNVPWKQLVLIAAGDVNLREFKRTHKDVIVADSGGFPIAVRDFDVAEVDERRLLADLFLSDGGRFRIQPKSFHYAYLGPRMKARSSVNFILLLRDLFRHASGASCNRGASMLAGDPPRTFRYPSRHAYEEELLWCLWARSQTQ